MLNSLVHGFGEDDEGQIDIKADKKDSQLTMEYRDNGRGIKPGDLAHIFEPFYTTNKKTGTGLGLHIVYNLVTQKLNGTIICESNPGKGVEFRLRLTVS